jgi:hypothetical protein
MRVLATGGAGFLVHVCAAHCWAAAIPSFMSITCPQVGSRTSRDISELPGSPLCNDICKPFSVGALTMHSILRHLQAPSIIEIWLRLDPLQAGCHDAVAALPSSEQHLPKPLLRAFD